MDRVVRVCSRLIVIDNGQKISEGALEQLIADAVVRAAYLGLWHAARRAVSALADRTVGGTRPRFALLASTCE